MPLPLLPILGGAAALGNSLYGIISGISQNNKARKMNPQRPTYEIPKEISENQAMFRNMANTTRLPGQSILENNIGANSAGSVNAMMKAGSGSGDILAGLSAVNQNTNQSLNDIAVRGAEFQAMNQDKLAGANETMAQFRDQAFDYNKNQPYMADMSRKMALQQSGAQNISSGLQGMSDYAANTYGFDPSQGGGGWNPTINFRKKNPQFGKVKYGQINYGQPNPLG